MRQRHPDGWRKRVQRRVRAGLPGRASPSTSSGPNDPDRRRRRTLQWSMARRVLPNLRTAALVALRALIALSFPKIISARSNDAVLPESAERPWAHVASPDQPSGAPFSNDRCEERSCGSRAAGCARSRSAQSLLVFCSRDRRQFARLESNFVRSSAGPFLKRRGESWHA